MRKVKTEEDKAEYENINSDYSGLYEEFRQIMVESLKTERTPTNNNNNACYKIVNNLSNSGKLKK